jgi:dynein heavy chain
VAKRGQQAALRYPLPSPAQVDEMQKELVQAQVVVQAASQECDRLLTEITTSTADAEAKQAAALAKEAQLATDSEAIAVEKAEAEAALAMAIPALEEAASALSNLKKDDITQIKSYNNPPIMVQKVGRVVEGVRLRVGAGGAAPVVVRCSAEQ